MGTKVYFLNTIIPKTAVLEMTYNCNHKCVFCSVPWDSPRHTYEKLPELTPQEWMECIDGLVNCGIRNIAFSGGEPLLKSGLEEIIVYARSKRTKEAVFNETYHVVGFQEKELEISIITNGELINEHWITLFKKYHLIVNVSLPGIKTFKELSGGGDYQRPLSAIRKASDAGLDVVVSICVTKKNLPELFETISLGFLNGAKQLLLNRFLPGGRGLNYAELCLDKEEIIFMLDTAEQVCLEANTFGSVGTELPKCVIKKEYKMISVGTLCSGGVDFFAIDPSGKVRPCNHSPVRLGDFRNISSAIKTDYWQKFKCKDFLPEGCLGCILSMQCDGGCREAAHIVGGNFNSKDPLFLEEESITTRI